MAKQVPKQLVDAVSWIRANSITATFCGLVLIVPVGAYFAADAFGSGVRSEADRKVKTYAAVSSALSARVDLPVPGGEPLPLEGLPNGRTVEEFREILRGLREDAGSVYAEALAFNVGSGVDAKRPVVDATLFPNYPPGRADSVRTPFFRAIQKAYADLLARANAGSPPDPAVLASTVDAAEKRFVQGELKQQDKKNLDAAQLKLLEEALGKARLGRCLDVAKQISFYADLSAFALPTEAEILQLYKSPKDRAAHDRFLFELQWKLWIATDVVSAFSDANGGGSVLQAPVKRLVRLTVAPLAKTQSAPSGEAAAMGDSGASADVGASVDGSVDGSVGGASAESASGEAAPAPAAAVTALGKPIVDPAVDAPRDFTKGLTGRVSNAVYDVRSAEVVFVAETSRLPKVFSALAAQNFMTVTDVRMAPADPFTAARAGFVYGSAPVVEVTATIETVWLRELTAPSMPLAVRGDLGVQTEAPGMGQAEGGDAAAGG